MTNRNSENNQLYTNFHRKIKRICKRVNVLLSWDSWQKKHIRFRINQIKRVKNDSFQVRNANFGKCRSNLPAYVIVLLALPLTSNNWLHQYRTFSHIQYIVPTYDDRQSCSCDKLSTHDLGNECPALIYLLETSLKTIQIREGAVAISPKMLNTTPVMLSL